MSTCTHMFAEVCEAYEVLSDEKKRKVYDEYGERGLKGGVEKAKWAGYAFSGDSFKIFKDFFGSRSPYQLEIEYKEDELVADEDLNLEVKVYCSLEEIYKGCFKTVEYKRQKVMPDGRTYGRETVSKLVEIQPGFGKDTIIKFPDEGHEAVAQRSGELHVKVVQQSHSDYDTAGYDLIYNRHLTLSEALSCEPFKVNTLDG